jgi:hypothetical protein
VSDQNTSAATSHLWHRLSQAGLTETDPEDIGSRIQEARHAVIERLHQLLDGENQPVECESAASALGTLSELRRRIQTRQAPVETSPKDLLISGGKP